MEKKCILIMVGLTLLTSCSAPSTPLPSPKISISTGMTFLPDISPTGLESPIWSPDGTKIVASYNIMPMADFCFGCPTPRSDVVLIDPETGKSSILLQQDGFNVDLHPLAWSQDSRSIALYFWDNEHGHGIFTITVEKPNPRYFIQNGSLSPDWEKISLSDSDVLRIITIKTNETHTIKLPEIGNWSNGSWSLDENLLVVTYRKNKDDRFENIYLLNVSSGSVDQFSNDNMYFKNSPSISPNGNLIAYTAWRFTNTDIESKVFISRIDRTCNWTLPINHVNYFTWSPESNKVFLTTTGGAYIADLEKIFGKNIVEEDGCP